MSSRSQLTTPRLRWVQFQRSSIEHVFSHPLITNDKIRFSTLSGADALQAAEYVMMSLLSLGHHIPGILWSQHNLKRDAKHWRQVKPIDLRDSTVGILGYGSVGRELARLLQPFNVKILATKYDAMNLEDKGYTLKDMGDPEGYFFNRLYPYQAIRSMLKECDFVVITLPLTDKTRNIIGEETLAALKPHSCLVNISHRLIVNEDALIKALYENKLGGAVLDVFHDDLPPKESLLWKMNNVILSPRIAWVSGQDLERAMELFAENLKRYLNGTGLLNRFDPKKGY